MKSMGRFDVVILLFVGAGPLYGQGVAGTPHDLSASGPGPIRALEPTDACLFCHTPHTRAVQSARWNRELSTARYRIYESSSLDARPSQPTGASKFCLSCHDGTIALGNVLSRERPIAMTVGAIPQGRTNLGTDLSDDHPVSFRYDSSIAGADPQIVHPAELGRLLPLDPQGELQCTTCHDAHDNSNGHFLRISNDRSGLCITCHQRIGWTNSSHANATRRTPVTGDRRFDWEPMSVGDNACNSCHTPHAAGGRVRLLRAEAEEENCLVCHDGKGSRFDIASLTQRGQVHDGRSWTGVHQPGEDPLTMSRHVECVDCHNPHAATAMQSRPLDVGGPIARVPGVSDGGTPLDFASLEYEVCFRCHGDSAPNGGARVRREIVETNTRDEFAVQNPSYHPVIGPTRNSNTQSLDPSISRNTTIKCTDCHNSDAARRLGGSGPNGPHGSTYEPLLAYNYETRDPVTESEQAYALCYQCHLRRSILADESFPSHRQHVVTERIACSVCHDAHGISRSRGNERNNTHLINFDIDVVRQVTGAAVPIEFVDLGDRRGTCTVTCHGTVHMQTAYGPG